MKDEIWEGKFDDWCWKVNALCVIHLYCSWADLCGDIKPLEQAYDADETPRQFVEQWAEKYDLIWYEGGQLWA
mgnify:CR=1 FL=1